MHDQNSQSISSCARTCYAATHLEHEQHGLAAGGAHPVRQGSNLEEAQLFPVHGVEFQSRVGLIQLQVQLSIGRLQYRAGAAPVLVQVNYWRSRIPRRSRWCHEMLGKVYAIAEGIRLNIDHGHASAGTIEM